MDPLPGHSMTRSLFAPVFSLLLLVATPIVVSGCTCNEASNPAARGQGRAGKAKMKMKLKGKRKRKGKRKADIPRVTVGVFYIDTNKLEAGMPVAFDVLCNELKGLGMNISLEKKQLEGGSLL